LRQGLAAVLEAAPAAAPDGRAITPVRASVRDMSDLSRLAVSRGDEAG
jgi:hypothetical protein